MPTFEGKKTICNYQESADIIRKRVCKKLAMKNSMLSHGKGKVLKKKVQHSAKRVMKARDMGMRPMKLKISKVFQKPSLLQLEKTQELKKDHKEEEEIMRGLVSGLELETNIDTMNKWKEVEVALEAEKFLGGLELAAKIDDEARLGCNKLKLLPTVAKLLLTPKCKLLQE